jgi:hypothetical protein
VFLLWDRHKGRESIKIERNKRLIGEKEVGINAAGINK